MTDAVAVIERWNRKSRANFSRIPIENASERNMTPLSLKMAQPPSRSPVLSLYFFRLSCLFDYVLLSEPPGPFDSTWRKLSVTFRR